MWWELKPRACVFESISKVLALLFSSDIPFLGTFPISSEHLKGHKSGFALDQFLEKDPIPQWASERLFYKLLSNQFIIQGIIFFFFFLGNHLYTIILIGWEIIAQVTRYRNDYGSISTICSVSYKTGDLHKCYVWYAGDPVAWMRNSIWLLRVSLHV